MSTDKTFLTNFIRQTYPISDNIIRDIAAHFQFIEIQKNDFILKEGKVCNNYIFLETGFARAYSIDTEGNEVTTNFYGQRSIVFEVVSFFKRTPSRENIQALTNCTGWYIDFEKLNMLFHAIPEFREFGRTILVNGFTSLKERMLSMISNSAEQRYEYLLHSNPEIFQNAPLKNIASYLGITDTSLSRIRKEMVQK